MNPNNARFKSRNKRLAPENILFRQYISRHSSETVIIFADEESAQ